MTTENKRLTRIAPTPSGYLHRGNGYAFLLTWLWAKTAGADLLLRIDDADRARFRIEYLEDIFICLDLLDIDYQIGPTGPTDFEAQWSQRFRDDLYQQALGKLKEADLLYACSCSRRDYPTNAAYPCICLERQGPLDQKEVSWRLKTPARLRPILQNFQGKTRAYPISDALKYAILRRKNGAAAYQLTSVCDDHYFGVSHIVRGADLFESSIFQLYLSNLLYPNSKSWKMHHHPLITEVDGRKLSKSQQSPPLREILEHPSSRSAFFTAFGNWLGLSEHLDSPRDLKAALPENFRLPQAEMK